MQVLSASRVVAFVMGSVCSLSVITEEVRRPPCAGLPRHVSIGGLCPPKAASFCILEGKACEASDAKLLSSRVRITVGNDKVCGQFLRENPEHVAFGTEHNLPTGSIETYLFGGPDAFALSLDIGPNAAHFDADNDGTPEYIVLVRIPGSGRYPCDAFKFFHVDEGRALVQGPLTALLGGLPGCPGTLPVRLNGTTYFVSRTSLIGNYGTRQQLLWQVYEFRDWSMRKMCEFRYQ